MSGSCSVVCGMSFPCRRRVVRGSSRLVRVCRVCGVCRVSGVCRIRRDGVPVGVSGLVRTFFCPVLVRGLHIRPTVPVLPHGVAASGLGRNTEPSASSPLRRCGAADEREHGRARPTNAVEGADFLTPPITFVRGRPICRTIGRCPICIPRRTVESFPRPRRPIRPTDFCISPYPAVSSACTGAYRLVGVRSAGAAGRLRPGTPAFVHSLAAVFGVPRSLGEAVRAMGAAAGGSSDARDGARASDGGGGGGGRRFGRSRQGFCDDGCGM